VKWIFHSLSESAPFISCQMLKPVNRRTNIGTLWFKLSRKLGLGIPATPETVNGLPPAGLEPDPKVVEQYQDVVIQSVFTKRWSER
jgi:hypothetical protein|tara:strand:+ start:579 stop:836 length:258 start_codon:yes stop_codon:yes gene_type:complete